MKFFFSIAFLLTLSLTSIAHAETSLAGDCQHQEVVSVCPVNRSGVAALQIIYKGYLLGKGRPVIAMGYLNGVKFARFLDQGGDRSNGFKGVTYLPFVQGHLEVWFYNTYPEYDSRYGQNYHFNF